MASSSRVLFALLALAAFTWHSQPFVNVRGPAPRASRTALLAESSFSLPVYEETVDNKGSASVVFCFILGLVFPVFHGFTFGLLLAALGYGLWKGSLVNFAKKTEATKEYAGYVSTLGEASLTAGEYSLKAYNFVAQKLPSLGS
mmetsp:Transcript_86864/g.202200  ORF Transcript_86864/g.202200 Transcript_86864/m.202200 type:complete len:144 (-) Transcript_86864:145-576(-)